MGSTYDLNVEDKACKHNVVEELTWKAEKKVGDQQDIRYYDRRWGETDLEFGSGISCMKSPVSAIAILVAGSYPPQSLFSKTAQCKPAYDVFTGKPQIMFSIKNNYIMRRVRYHSSQNCTVYNACQRGNFGSRGGFALKLMKLKLQDPSLARAPSKALGGAINKYPLSYLIFIRILYSFS